MCYSAFSNTKYDLLKCIMTVARMIMRSFLPYFQNQHKLFTVIIFYESELMHLKSSRCEKPLQDIEGEGGGGWLVLKLLVYLMLCSIPLFILERRTICSCSLGYILACTAGVCDDHLWSVNHRFVAV